MHSPTRSVLPSRQLANLQARFLVLLPALEAHGRIYFRDLPCLHRKAD